MKRVLCALIAAVLLLCCIAAAETKVIRPMYVEMDLSQPEDGIYYVAFDPSDIGDGMLKLSVYSQDCYDIADIAEMSVWDTIIVGDEAIVVVTLERDDDLMINGGLDEEGINLRAYDEDNCWRVAMEDDYTSYTYRGDAVWLLDEEVSFTDGWDIESEPQVITGADAVTKAIAGTEMEHFDPYCTAVRVENGKIVEIERWYTP
ncbi:MAG: hypothetical protein K5784_09450 [Clostridiales bacterium]|nr:hypothetical protein [Clostridiales bacterium]